MRTEIEPQIDYITSMYVEETDNQKAIRAELEKSHIAGMSVGAHEGLILAFLIKSMGLKNIIEVGTLYGYSTSWMASALPEDGKIFSLEKSEENFKKASELLANDANSDKIKLLLGDARENLSTLSAGGPYDLIFIDADKGSYPDYLDWAEENIKKGGLIIGDNTFLFGHMYEDDSRKIKVSKNQLAGMTSFNQRLQNKQKFFTCMLPTSEGMSLARVL